MRITGRGRAVCEPDYKSGVAGWPHAVRWRACPGAERQRFGADGARLNGRMGSRQLRKFCALDEEGKGLLRQAMDELGLSARAHDRILRVARTVADLEGSADIRPGHLVEAIGYRSLDRKLWAR